MLPYRPNVMACIFRKSDNKVLMGHSTGYPTTEMWQFPQGGINQDDTPKKTVFKEVYEEMGIQKDLLKIIAEYPEWLAYNYPKTFKLAKIRKGQKQRIFLLEFIGKDSDINLNIENPPEFDQFKWVNIEDVLPHIVAFKKPTYRKIIPYFKRMILTHAE